MTDLSGAGEAVAYQRGRVDAQLEALRRDQDKLERTITQATVDGRAELRATEERFLARVDTLEHQHRESEARLAARLDLIDARQGDRSAALAAEVRSLRAGVDDARSLREELPQLLAKLRRELAEDAATAAEEAVKAATEAGKPNLSARLVTVVQVLVGLLAAAYFGLDALPSALAP